MKRYLHIVILFAGLAMLAGCNKQQREAKRMVARAEALAETAPDSTARLIDSVLQMPVYFSERQRMEMALLQAEALFGNAPLDDDLFEDTAYHVTTSPELERAADYYIRKRQYAKAAHAALYSGYLQQHYNENENAMRSYKVAEQYGLISNDSLTAARAEFRMGKMLLDDGLEQEALVLLQAANLGFSDHYSEKALVLNMMGICYMLQEQYDSAETLLKKSLDYAEMGYSSKAKTKALNSSAVLYRLQGKYDDAIACLRQMTLNPDLNKTDLFVLYLNFGKTCIALREMDSTKLYYQHVENLLLDTEIKIESRISACGALSRFAEQQGDIQATLKYSKQRENLLSEVLVQRQNKAIYRIQQQYDYESLQNETNQKLIWRQHLITLLSLFIIIGLTALVISQIRLAKTRKQEAETKANLFHFMQQNKELVQKSEEQELAQIYLTQKQKETATEYGERLSFALKKEQSVMLRLHLFLQNMGDEELLKKLEKTVFGKKTHWDAMMETVDRLYPQLREIVKQENLGLDENEQKDVILSYFNVSRQDEALLLDKTTDMVDKIRNRSRKKIQAASKENTLPDIK